MRRFPWMPVVLAIGLGTLPVLAAGQGGDLRPIAFALEAPATADPALAPLDHTVSWWRYDPGPPAEWFWQDDLLDDGDGIVSVGDTLVLAGIRYPITGIHRAFWTTRWRDYNDPPRPQEYQGTNLLIPPDTLEITGPVLPTVPWEVYDLDAPNPLEYEWHPDMHFYYDIDGNGVVDPGDRFGYNLVGPGGFFWEIDLVTLVIRSNEFAAVDVRPTGWGALKRIPRTP